MLTDYKEFEKQTRDRLNQVERELRYWRLAGILTFAGAVVVLAGAMAEPPAKELRVETLKIAQRDGKERLVLTAVPGVPDMTFLDPAGHTRLTLDIADDNKPVVAIADSGGAKGRLELGIENGSPVLRLFDRDGMKRVVLGVPKDIGALLRTFDENGRTTGRFP